ncbi:predicted protein [Sclerotinia sclerotiorum 1980 UF-70]|uniref:Uncharacterized protein n=1 Tax=Sclerotinia sclerotiorum (strain ATCC 18683 / 1980 / Ss-1) TaxID=665079 RepID=A7E4D6_SCLS1|nr:predicted protein [Sclerotinia sclerotiorum 1980 UF-70]EDN90758.1 predicted protein [Sclerotinia sclerotiorum 1980 UF-70]
MWTVRPLAFLLYQQGRINDICTIPTQSVNSQTKHLGIVRVRLGVRRSRDLGPGHLNWLSINEMNEARKFKCLIELKL